MIDEREHARAGTVRGLHPPWGRETGRRRWRHRRRPAVIHLAQTEIWLEYDLFGLENPPDRLLLCAVSTCTRRVLAHPPVRRRQPSTGTP
jgi:hypothetical protein